MFNFKKLTPFELSDHSIVSLDLPACQNLHKVTRGLTLITGGNPESRVMNSKIINVQLLKALIQRAE